jgi:hypothetical protein
VAFFRTKATEFRLTFFLYFNGLSRVFQSEILKCVCLSVKLERFKGDIWSEDTCSSTRAAILAPYLCVCVCVCVWERLLWSLAAFNMMNDGLCPWRVLYVTLRTSSLSPSTVPTKLLLKISPLVLLVPSLNDGPVVRGVCIDRWYWRKWRELKQMTEASVLRGDKQEFELPKKKISKN